MSPTWPFLAANDDDGVVERELKLALKAAGLLEKHRGIAAAAVRQARLVDRIDERGLNPAGKLDNVSLAMFLRYLTALGLVVRASGQRKKATAEVDDDASVAAVMEFRALAQQRRRTD